MIKDQVNLDQIQTLLNPYCHSCKIRGHNFLNCNQIHYIADKDFIIKKSNFSHTIKERIKFTRTHKKRKNALIFKQKFERLKKRFGMKAFLSFIDSNKSENIFENKDRKRSEKSFIKVSNDFYETTKETNNENFNDNKINKNNLNFEKQKKENDIPEIFMMDFERSWNFEKYYPEGNLQKIIMSLKNQWYKEKSKQIKNNLQNLNMRP